MVTVRTIRETDIEAIAALEREIFSDAWSVQGIWDTFLQSQAFIIVAEQENRLVGYCIIYYVLDEGEIARIAVDSSWRRQGVGQKLLDAVKENCVRKGISRLLLDVRQSNEAAQKFYAKYGFGVDGIRKNFYDLPKEDAVLMSIELH